MINRLLFQTNAAVAAHNKYIYIFFAEITTFFIVKRKEKNKPKEVESVEVPTQLAIENEDKSSKEPSETDKLEVSLINCL